MLQYIIRRLLLIIPTMCGIIVISFCIIKLAPGDPAAQKFGGAGQANAGQDAAKGTESAMKRFRERNHFDKPLYKQFGYFLERLFTLDLKSFSRNKLIISDLKEHMWVSIRINLIVFFLIYLISVPLGIFSAAKSNTLADQLITLALFMLYSLPSFWMAQMLGDLLGDRSNFIWFPTMGLHSSFVTNGKAGVDFSWFAMTTDYLHHLVLPVVCLTYGGLAYLSRQMRAGMLEVIKQDYIRTAKAKGASNMRILFVHALRNGLFPIITIFASLLPFLVGGSVIIETIFNIPGMGKYAFDAVMSREYDIVMATLILSAILTLFGILISDILYVLVNPQVSFQNRSS